MLEIIDLSVEVGERRVLKDINLTVPTGSTSVLFGPNGSGKSTLLATIMGLGGYKVVTGKILLNGENITDIPVNERAKKGIGMMSQRPPNIVGVPLRTMLKVVSKGGSDPESFAGTLGMDRFLDRDVNVGFSGGEIKDQNFFSWQPRTHVFIFWMSRSPVWI